MSNSINQSTQNTYTTQPSSYLNDIKILQGKLPAILDDFKKYYVFFNKNPTYSEYQSIYENLKSNMNSINNELLTIYQNVNNDSQNLSTALSNINKLIDFEKKRNQQLTSYSQNINNNYTGSEKMIDDYKKIYIKNFLKTILMFLGIVIEIIILIKIFGSKSNVNTVNITTK
jgi:hypothetical protein